MLPINEAITAEQAEVSHSNHYTEPNLPPLRGLISDRVSTARDRRQVRPQVPLHLKFVVA
jgi:hypothetical protein